VFRPVVCDIGSDTLGCRLDQVAAGEVGKKPGLREDCQVWRVATLGTNTDLGFEFLARLVLDVDAVLFFPLRPGLVQKICLGVGDGAVEGDDAVSVAVVTRPGGGASVSAVAGTSSEDDAGRCEDC